MPRSLPRALCRAAGAGAVLLGSLVSLGEATAAPGQEAAAIDEGRATGRANVVSVSPNAGSLSFAIGGGEAIAETVGGLAQAQSQSIDLGLIGTSLTAEPCRGGDPGFTPEQLPNPTRIDNRNGPGTAESTEAPLAAEAFGVGHEEVAATVVPSASATVTFTDADLAPVLGIAGGRAVAEAEVFPGAGREARSTVTMDLDIAGIVQMTGLRWNARHRTGGEDGVDADFTIEALQVLGIPVPADDVDVALQAINTALAAIGFRIELPVVERITEPVDVVRVTPLRILIADSPLGAAAVLPALELTRELRSQVFEAATAAICDTASMLLLVEILVGVGSGTGSLVASVGGVEATSATVPFEDLFGGAPSMTATDPGAGQAVAGSPGTPGVAAAAPGPLGAAPPSAAPGAAVATRPIGAFEQLCESVHPFRWPSCSHGAAGVVGVVGVAAALAVGFLDLRRRRHDGTEVLVP